MKKKWKTVSTVFRSSFPLAKSGVKTLTTWFKTKQLAQNDPKNYDGLCGSRSKNGRSHFKLILCCSLPNISSHNNSWNIRKISKNIKKKPNYRSYNFLHGLIGSGITKSMLVLVSSEVPSCLENSWKLLKRAKKKEG